MFVPQLERRHEQMKRNLEAQYKELEEKKRVFDDEKLHWEAQQRILEQQKLDASKSVSLLLFHSFISRLLYKAIFIISIIRPVSPRALSIIDYDRWNPYHHFMDALFTEKLPFYVEFSTDTTHSV